MDNLTLKVNDDNDDNAVVVPPSIDEKKIMKRLKLKAEEERRKAAERAMLSRWLTSRLESEERTSRFNAFRVNHEHLRRARAEKSAEIRREMETSLPRFETRLAGKQIRVAHLVDDLADAEKQRKTARQSHADVVDRLVEMEKDRVEILSAEFAEELRSLKTEFETEFRRLVDERDRETKTADEIDFVFDAKREERLREMAAAFESKKYEAVGETIEEKFALRSNLEAKIDGLWREFRQVVRRHEEDTGETRRTAKRLGKKDEESRAEIERHKRKIGRLEAEVERLKAECQEIAVRRGKTNGAIEAEKKRLMTKLKGDKASLEKTRKRRGDVLKKMVVESTAAMEDLNATKKRGALILSLAEICRKLETEEEKVLPWPPTSLSVEELEAVDDAIEDAARASARRDGVDAETAAPTDDDIAGRLADHFLREMSLFWRRVAKVDLEVAAMAAEKAEAKAENLALKKMVEDYFKGIAVGAETMAEKKIVGGKIGTRKRLGID